MNRPSKRWPWTPAALTAIVLVLCGPVSAQRSPASTAPGRGLDERIDVALKDAAPAELFRSFAEILGLDAVIPPGLERTLTMELRDVRVATVLTAACESVGCLWRIEDGHLVVVRDPEASERMPAAAGRANGPSAAKLEAPIDMELEDADLRQVLEAFGSIAGAAVEIDPSLAGTVTIQLSDTPVRLALDAACRVGGCGWELIETTGGPVLRFSPR